MARVRRQVATRPRARFPDELRSRLHPFWQDTDAVAAKYGAWLPAGYLSTIRRNAYFTVLREWARRNGYTSASGGTDFCALRESGLID